MIGSVVGNYKIIDKIGEGGMGAVFKGVDLMLEREVAIKMLRPELARQPNVVERFRTEAVTLAKLNHTNVATLHSFFRQGEDFFMVMEFVSGQTLSDLIRTQGSLQCDRAVELFCMALEGIDHAHKMGIVHRDIKPANMMLTETGSIKVMDFGIARVLGTDRLTKAGHLVGTVEYMSPEQVRGEETDARSDIYSLGILLYEMLTGRVPFTSNSDYELMRSQIEDAPSPPSTLAQHIPPAVEQAIMRALAKKPEARHQSASEFRSMLLQKDSGAVTRLDAAAAASYVTRTSEPVVSASPSGQAINGARLAADAVAMPGGIGSQLKETRLGPTADVQPGYEPTTRLYPTVQPKVGVSVSSLLGKLNWKHYAGAVAVLVALITVPLVLIGGGGKSTTTNSQPSLTSPETTPAQGVTPGPNQPASSTAPVQTDNKGGSENSSAGTKPAQSDPSASAQTPQDESSIAQKNSGSKGERSSTARRSGSNEKGAGKKAKTDKGGGAAAAVGGAFKKLGGLFGKKKKP
jgi:serine/threonine protein kinase